MAITDTIRAALESFDASSVVDILSIAVLIYLSLLLLKGTTAMSLLRGIIIMVLGAVIAAQVLNLTVLDWWRRAVLSRSRTGWTRASTGRGTGPRWGWQRGRTGSLWWFRRNRVRYRSRPMGE